MSPNNLRSVIAQVTRGGKSVVSRRDFSTGYRRKLSSSRRRYESGGSDMLALFSSSAKFGFHICLGYEIIQILEYCRTMQIDIDEHAGRKSEAPLRHFLGHFLRFVFSGKPGW